MSRERRFNAPTLADAATTELGCPRSGEFFDKCDRLIPWSTLAESVSGVFAADRGQGGRPRYPLVMMLKCLLLAKWFNLSDPMLEGMLRDRLSFRRFVGLGLSDETPDETTFVKFRKRLRDEGGASKLFDEAVDHLRRAGLVVHEGTLVDATIITAPRGRSSDDGLGHTKDKAASYTKKHGKTYHGYKAHIATDRRGLIVDYVFDTARVHDSRHIDQLVEAEVSQAESRKRAAAPAAAHLPGAQLPGAVYADSAYMDKDRKARLEGSGVFCGIVERRVRGQSALTDQQVEHNRSCAAIRAIVEHPFAWMKNMGHRVARYWGLGRNALDFALMAVAYNFKRSFSLIEPSS